MMDCAHDCFRCPFPDCITDEETPQERRAAERRDTRDRQDEDQRKKALAVERWRKGHPERWREIQRAAYERNKDRCLKYGQQYYQAHREERLAYARKHREEHREEINARRRELRRIEREQRARNDA